MATEDLHGVVTLSGDGSVDQVLRRAVAEIESLGLDVVAVIDHSGDAHEVGVAMPETKLVLFGSPEVTTRLVLAHPVMALHLPLKVLIRERTDGHVCVSYEAPGHLARTHHLTNDEADGLQVVETVARAVGSTS